MAKKIRFPLVLSDGTQARSLDELKEHFDLESVLGYYKSGKLLTWLRDRYIETEADAIEALDENAPDFQQKLCEIFGVEFSGSGVDMEEIIRRQERMVKLRQFTDEDEFIQNIDAVAFDQEELIDLLDEGCEKIYLCGEMFTVPASQKDKTYVGVNLPKVKISGNIGGNQKERSISFLGCNVVNLPKEKSPEPLPKEKTVQTALSEPKIQPVQITINSKYTQENVFEYPFRFLVGTDYYQKILKSTTDAFDRLMFLGDKPQMTKNIEDVYPVFSSVFKNVDVFAKLWVANMTLGEPLYYRVVVEIRMKDSDKYMIMQMNSQYSNIWDLKLLSISFTNGIPNNIRDSDSYIIAKEILRKPLTEKEQERLAEIRKMFRR